jgi:hypothetical protein
MKSKTQHLTRYRRMLFGTNGSDRTIMSNISDTSSSSNSNDTIGSVSYLYPINIEGIYDDTKCDMVIIRHKKKEMMEDFSFFTRELGICNDKMVSFSNSIADLNLINLNATAQQRVSIQREKKEIRSLRNEMRIVIQKLKDTLVQLKCDLVIISEHEQACILKERLRVHSEIKNVTMPRSRTQFGKRHSYNFY